MTVIRPPRHAALRHRAWPLCCRQCTGIAIELGSSRTRAWALGRGIILDVRTVTFRSGASHPVQRGTIVDPEGASQMLDRLLGRRLPLFGHTVIALTTPVLGGIAYREAAREALRSLRPAAVVTIPTAKAIALGAGAGAGSGAEPAAGAGPVTDAGQDAEVQTPGSRSGAATGSGSGPGAAAGAGSAPFRPQLIVDVGAHLTEVFLLTEGEVADAHRAELGTDDLDRIPSRRIVGSVVDTLTAMLRRDTTSQTLDALQHGVLVAGGGALRPEITHGLSKQLHVPVRTAPAPHTAAVRGAARHLQAVHTHPPHTFLHGTTPHRR
ncbi:hypothetical protein HCC61_02075 [Streptomyces sp. HNM0575]|uniref:rod shape-determining protein n=1 Tax=Streptomyces sp. HNM0575 TaxID=2716338 RepID=UPI00145F546A|nr:rod shape-determining protein [Streptomyces sp. HNM0575]NLU71491.1 hypothetical protein [Streptomyces sp. HNM0575]